MRIVATFENGNQQYVTKIIRNDAGVLTDAGTSYYPKHVDAELEELQALLPDVKFEIEGPV